jgi:hypothetical protein
MLLPLSWSHLQAIDFGAALKQQIWIPRPTWTVDDIPDLTGKVVIVTGGNNGLGKETAKVSCSKPREILLNDADRHYWRTMPKFILDVAAQKERRLQSQTCKKQPGRREYIFLWTYPA